MVASTSTLDRGAPANRSGVQLAIEVNGRAARILERDVALIRRGDRALLGLGFAGEILAHAWMTPEQLEQFATRAAAIATEIRRESQPAPKRKPRAKPRQSAIVAFSQINAEPEPANEIISLAAPPEPTLIELAIARNRAQVERLRDRLAAVRASH